MARRKLARIKQYDLAKARLAALKSIDQNLDLGNGLTVAIYKGGIDNFTNLLAQYNTALSTVDDLYNQCNESLAQMQDLSERMLSGVASKFGKTSSQYEMAGGTRKPEKKKPGSAKPAAPKN